MATVTDEETFAELYGNYYQDIFSYCYRGLGNREQAEDMTQDTFCRAWRGWSRFDGQRPRPWLFRIATNVMLDLFRRQQVVRFVTLEQLDMPGTVEGVRRKAFDWRFASRDDTAAEALRPLEVAELREQVAATMGRLSERHQRVLWLTVESPHWQSMHWVAAEEGITHGAAKSLAFRARRQFREEWAA